MYLGAEWELYEIKNQICFSVQPPERLFQKSSAADFYYILSGWHYTDPSFENEHTPEL